jgi:hypothetical protein
LEVRFNGRVNMGGVIFFFHEKGLIRRGINREEFLFEGGLNRELWYA